MQQKNKKKYRSYTALRLCALAKKKAYKNGI